MLNQLIVTKIKERINKLDSSDYLNIEPYQFIEAFNKAQSDWSRRQLQGVNQTKTGAEGSIRRIDDLQVLLREWVDTWTVTDLYIQSKLFPDDYMEWCRISASAQDECKECPPRKLVIFMGNEADVDIYLADLNRQPSYEWATTFSTIAGNRFRIWTNDQFDVVDPIVHYYRAPVNIEMTGVTNPNTGFPSPADVLCIFPDNVIEVIIEEACGILTGDIENFARMQSLQQATEHNT